MINVSSHISRSNQLRLNAQPGMTGAGTGMYKGPGATNQARMSAEAEPLLFAVWEGKLERGAVQTETFFQLPGHSSSNSFQFSS